MRIAVIGPQNTGKSTFVKDFLKAFPHYSSPKKTYRDVIEKKKLKVNQKGGEDAQRMIRDFMFDQINKNKSYNCVFDRCMIDNFVYTSILYERGLIPKYFVDETEAMMIDMLHKIDLYLFIPTSVSVQLVDDGTRDIESEFIDRANFYFIKTLFNLSREHRISVKVISGNREGRIKQIKELI